MPSIPQTNTLSSTLSKCGPAGGTKMNLREPGPHANISLRLLTMVDSPDSGQWPVQPGPTGTTHRACFSPNVSPMCPLGSRSSAHLWSHSLAPSIPWILTSGSPVPLALQEHPPWPQPLSCPPSQPTFQASYSPGAQSMAILLPFLLLIIRCPLLSGPASSLPPIP